MAKKPDKDNNEKSEPWWGSFFICNLLTALVANLTRHLASGSTKSP